MRGDDRAPEEGEEGGPGPPQNVSSPLLLYMLFPLCASFICLTSSGGEGKGEANYDGGVWDWIRGTAAIRTTCCRINTITHTHRLEVYAESWH